MVLKVNKSESNKLLNAFASYAKDGGEYVITIEKVKQIRSMKQNKYYWKIVIPIISESFGYTRDEMHQILSGYFLKYTNEDGEEFVTSTTALNKKEFNDYIDKIRHWADEEHEIDIPLPNQMTNEMYIKIQNTYNY